MKITTPRRVFSKTKTYKNWWFHWDWEKRSQRARWKKKNEKKGGCWKKQAFEKKKKKKEKKEQDEKEMWSRLKELNKEFKDIKEHKKGKKNGKNNS